MTASDAPGSPRAPSPAELAQRIRARQEVASRDLRLPDDALVMRGGTLGRDDLLKAVEKARVELKRPGLTVYTADVPTPADLLSLKPLMYGQISFTRLGRLREAFEVEQTFEWPHHTAWFPPDDEEDDGFWVQMFQRAFDLPVARSDVASYRVS